MASPEDRPVIGETASLLAAEIVLAAVAAMVYLAGALVDRREVWRWMALGGLALAAAALAAVAKEAPAGVAVEADGLARYARWLALGVGALLVLLAWRPLPAHGTAEYLGSLLLAIAGLMLVAVARDLVTLFVALEMVSIPTYVLLYLGRRDVGSQEATVKYFYLSVLASAMLLYGFSFLYGAAGSMDLGEIHHRLAAGPTGPSGFGAFARAATVLIFAGLGFRIAAVPFHFYAPDVFQGTSTANAGLLSVVPKIAGMVALVRLAAAAMPGVQPYAWPVALVLAALSMTVANLLALWQDNLRRLLAYSSIANAGFLLVGLTAYLACGGTRGPWDGAGGLLFYLVAYALATVGAFAVLACLGRDDDQVESVEELAGLAWSAGPIRPVLAVLLAIFLFSLTGVPPLAGFWGKLAVLASTLSLRAMPPAAAPWLVGLAVLGVLNSAIAAAYYLRIVAVIFFRTPQGIPAIKGDAWGTLVAAVACAILVVYIGVRPLPLLRAASDAVPAAVASDVRGDAPLASGVPVAFSGEIGYLGE